MPHNLQHDDVTFRLRRATASEWVAKNPILEEGEPAVEENTGRIKIGDGVTRWTLLPYSVPDALIRRLVNEAIVNAGGVIAVPAGSESTIPEEDDMSFVLLYENAKV